MVARDTLGGMRAIVVTRSVDLASPPERVWPFLADTERFNRLIGSHDVRYRPIEDGSASSARFVAETRAGGFKLVYEEFPFEWSHQRTFGVHRRMRGGPIESYTLALHAGGDAGDGRRRARSREGRAPRCAWRSRRAMALFAPIAWINAQALHREVRRAGGARRRARAGGRAEPLREARRRPPTTQRIAAAVQRMKDDAVAPALADRLGALVRERRRRGRRAHPPFRRAPTSGG